jgi:hypothetical protein
MIGAYRNGATAIRVLIVGMPGLLAAVVRETLDTERDMEVVAQIGSIDDFNTASLRHVDVVVTASRETGVPSGLKALLFGDAALPLVAISTDGSRIDVYGRTVTHGQGLSGLTGLIRDAVAVAQPPLGG